MPLLEDDYKPDIEQTNSHHCSAIQLQGPHTERPLSFGHPIDGPVLRIHQDAATVLLGDDITDDTEDRDSSKTVICTPHSRLAIEPGQWVRQSKDTFTSTAETVFFDCEDPNQLPSRGTSQINSYLPETAIVEEDEANGEMATQIEFPTRKDSLLAPPGRGYQADSGSRLSTEFVVDGLARPRTVHKRRSNAQNSTISVESRSSSISKATAKFRGLFHKSSATALTKAKASVGSSPQRTWTRLGSGSQTDTTPKKSTAPNFAQPTTASAFRSGLQPAKKRLGIRRPTKNMASETGPKYSISNPMAQTNSLGFKRGPSVSPAIGTANALTFNINHRNKALPVAPAVTVTDPSPILPNRIVHSRNITPYPAAGSVAPVPRSGQLSRIPRSRIIGACRGLSESPAPPPLPSSADVTSASDDVGADDKIDGPGPTIEEDRVPSGIIQPDKVKKVADVLAHHVESEHNPERKDYIIKVSLSCPCHILVSEPSCSPTYNCCEFRSSTSSCSHTIL